MATTGSVCVLQARVPKIKQRAKAAVGVSDEEEVVERGPGNSSSKSESVQLGPLPEVDAVPHPGSASTAPTTFHSLGLVASLLEALKWVGYTKPTDIQSGIIPHALEGKDVIGVSETGSGKTAAFALPRLKKLWDKPTGLFACVLAPTRELAYQIAQQFEGLGSAIGVRCVTIVGGMDMMSQSIALGHM
ncbi:P-loop containing nucleoside triphosphate hydrolase protein [Ceratobasidium sp. AG-I]|nr:P-loop containing nucleoside triphosphate hydrolase protein [Ceratobasidium sp. AG-I]